MKTHNRSLGSHIPGPACVKGGIPRLVLLLYFACTLSSGPAVAIEYPDSTKPGRAEADMQADHVTLQNDVLALTFTADKGKLRPLLFIDKASRGKINCAGSEFFKIVLDNGKTLSCSELRLAKSPEAERLSAEPRSPNLAGRFAGVKISCTLLCEEPGLEVDWSLLLRDGSNYVRQSLTLKALRTQITIKTIVLVDLPHAEAKVAGTVSGSPVAAGTMFFAYEHPNSTSQVNGEISSAQSAKRFICRLARNTPLVPAGPLTQSSVMGVVPRPITPRILVLSRKAASAALPSVPALQFMVRYRLGGPQNERG